MLHSVDRDAGSLRGRIFKIRKSRCFHTLIGATTYRGAGTRERIVGVMPLAEKD